MRHQLLTLGPPLKKTKSSAKRSILALVDRKSARNGRPTCKKKLFVLDRRSFFSNIEQVGCGRSKNCLLLKYSELALCHMCAYEKHANSHSAIEIPTRCVVPEWASTAKIAHSNRPQTRFFLRCKCCFEASNTFKVLPKCC